MSAILLLIKLSWHHIQDDSRQFAANLKTFGPTFFKDYPNANPFQSRPFVSIHASLSFFCDSFILFNSFKCLLQCFILLGVIRLHHFSWHGPFEGNKNFEHRNEASSSFIQAPKDLFPLTFNFKRALINVFISLQLWISHYQKYHNTLHLSLQNFA